MTIKTLTTQLDEQLTREIELLQRIHGNLKGLGYEF